MHFQIPTFAFALLAAATTTSALGINCDGSALCKGQSKSIMSGVLYNIGLTHQDSDVVVNGQQVACAGNFCAFLQNAPEAKTVAQVKGYVQALLNHGCQVCGSDPTEPGNDVSKGQLTVNYVSKPSA